MAKVRGKTRKEPPEIKVGETFIRYGYKGRIMAVSEGWIMARMTRCMPFIMTVAECRELLVMKATR
jgi:hypothetical protein